MKRSIDKAIYDLLYDSLSSDEISFDFEYVDEMDVAILLKAWKNRINKYNDFCNELILSVQKKIPQISNLSLEPTGNKRLNVQLLLKNNSVKKGHLKPYSTTYISQENDKYKISSIDNINFNIKYIEEELYKAFEFGYANDFNKIGNIYTISKDYLIHFDNDSFCVSLSSNLLDKAGCYFSLVYDNNSSLVVTNVSKCKKLFNNCFINDRDPKNLLLENLSIDKDDIPNYMKLDVSKILKKSLKR